jgi:CheY-like chemotaxis protein
MAVLNSNNISDDREDLPKVLLVIDDLPTVWITKIYLKEICRIESVCTGPEAIKAAQEDKFKIILMDINLGLGMDGIEALREIRKVTGYEETPIAAYTVKPVFGDEKYFLDAGFNYYIPRPFNKIDFQNKISEILN